MSDQPQPNAPGIATGGSGDERRAYARLSISLPGHLQAQGGPKHPCLIKDYCPGGVFVEVDGTHAGTLTLDDGAFQRGDFLSLSFSIQSNDVWRDFTVGARLAKAVGGGIGLTFERADPAAIQALSDLAVREQQARNERLSQARTRDPAQDQMARDLLVLCAERIEQFLRHVTPRAIDQASKLTFDKARDAINNAEQNEFYEAKDELDETRDELVVTFVDHIVERVRRLPEDGGQPAEKTFEEVDGGALALVDTGSFDEWVAIKNMVSQAEPQFRTMSAALDAQASFLAGVAIEHEDNPLGLASLSFAFHDAVQKVARNSRTRQSLVESFETTILPDLKALYTDLEKMFESRGIRPKPAAATQAVRRTPARAAPAAPGMSTHDEATAGSMVPETGAWQGAPAGHPQTGVFPTGAGGGPDTGMYPAVPQGTAPATGAYPAIPAGADPATGAYPAPPGTGAYQASPGTGAYQTPPGTGAYPISPGTGAYQAVPPNPNPGTGGFVGGGAAGPLVFQYPTGVAPVALGSAFGAAQNLLGFSRNPERARQVRGAAGPALAPGYGARPPEARAALMGALADLQEGTFLGDTTLFDGGADTATGDGTAQRPPRRPCSSRARLPP